jgi:Tol biopolymer transport system component
MKNFKNHIVGSLVLFLISFSLNAQNQVSPFGMFDNFSNVGAPKVLGNMSYDEFSQTYRVSGSSILWFAKDNCSFLWKKMSGDFIVQTQIHWSSDIAKSHRKAGIMIRSSLALDTTMIAFTNKEGCLYRKKAKENLEKIEFSAESERNVLQVERKGTDIILSIANFGEPFQVDTLKNVDLGNEVLAGLFVTSQNSTFLEQAEFSNTRIFNTAPDNLVQYTDYLGSLLEVVNLESGHRQVLGSSEGSWQAPNWTPDGKTLIYNSSGLLYNFDIYSGKSSVLNTDFAVKNNNDHVLTFDGKQIGISHHAKESNGQSVVYTLPVTGGIPKRITEKSPSYFHGWSPDNEWLLYTGQRNDDFDIYKISKDGGEEIQLTTAKGLDDGSEYSPDGKYIYFCSTRTGTMQVWRMDPDGKNQTQLTFDELNNWFPHVSPDNKWLVFISFPKEVPADKHPFYERVYIRLMPVSGGEPKVVAYLYGGQGSLNVPSWSPDGKRIAFVSNGMFE